MEQIKQSIRPLINLYHLFVAVSANIYYGFPSKKLKVIGVTGTDGKTTTTHLMYHILKTAGKKVSMTSSIYAKVGNEEFSTGLHVTTPDALLVQKLLKNAVENGDEYFVLETTSHGLDQNRNWGIHYEVSVITNITKEHLDYHKTYDRYVEAKSKIISQSKVSIINKDDGSYQHILRNVPGKRVLTYGLKNKADYTIDLRKQLKLLIADFNNYNYLAAYSVAKNLNIDDETIFSALKSFKLPLGRMDMVYDEDFKVFIDFAHTPNSLMNVLSELKIITTGRLIHVFGSAGLRDAQKRPAMGEASGIYSNVSIVTEEDYRTEDPLKIANEVAIGLKKQHMLFIDKSELHESSKGVYTIIIDRQEAINKAISIAKKGDLIVCTGKSHEQSLNRGGTEYPWNEFNAVQEALKSKNNKDK